RDVHRSAIHDRATLEIAGLAKLIRTDRVQPCNVRRRNLVEGRESGAGVVVGVHQPVSTLAGCREQVFMLRPRRTRRRATIARDELGWRQVLLSSRRGWRLKPDGRERA